jgi:hypothetical protein
MTNRPIRQVVLLIGATAMLGAAAIYLTQERKAATRTNDRIAISDLRSPIVLTENENAFILHEMRGLLESVRDIMEAIACALLPQRGAPA